MIYHGIIRTSDQPLYLICIKGKTVHCLDRTAPVRQFTIDPTEYRFKLALDHQNYDEALGLHRLQSSKASAYHQRPCWSTPT